MILQLTDGKLQRVSKPRRTPEQRKFITENIYKQFSPPPTQTNISRNFCTCSRVIEQGQRFCTNCQTVDKTRNGELERIPFAVITYGVLFLVAVGLLIWSIFS